MGAKSEYLKPDKMIFRIVTNGVGVYRVEYKSRWVGWRWLMVSKFSVIAVFSYAVVASFNSRQEAEKELRRAFGEQIEIVNEWRLA